MRCLALLTLVFTAGCGAQPEPPLVASDVTVTRPLPGMQMSAAYLSLTNNTDETIRISRVSSVQYASVQIHESVVEDGIARMRALPVLEIPAGATVRLERGGKHLMLSRPSATASTVTLQFLADDEPILTVEAPFEAEKKR